MTQMMQRSLGQIEGKIDMLLGIAAQVRGDLVVHVARDDVRFAAIERRTYWLSGAWSVFAAAMSGAAVWFMRGPT